MNKMIILFLFFSSAVFAQDKIHFYEDTAQMRKEMLSHIPIGTPIETAEKIMNANKCDCSYMKDEEFAAGKILHSHIDYLYCFHDQPCIWSSDHWQIAIVYKEGKVTDVLVAFSIIML
jgi:hypothetical protein